MTTLEGLDKTNTYIISHVGIIKFFAIWGILESFIYLVTKGDKFKEIIIHITVFIIITVIACAFPDLTDALK
jgi:hypothetical protein